MSPSATTFRALIHPIPPTPNLSTITTEPSSKPCTYCAALVPARQTANRGRIRTPYSRIITYPSFPELKESARLGCGMCRLLRKTIRSQWRQRPMEEVGRGVLTEKEGWWSKLFSTEWDRKVRISASIFALDPLVGGEGDDAQMGGIISSLNIGISPANLPYLEEDGEEKHREISMDLGFKIFDSVDLESRNEETRRRLPCLETLSDRNRRLIESWVQDCKTNHPNCITAPSAARWLPTRLLQMGASGPESLRLFETARLGPTQKPFVEYIALSHMWGDSSLSPPFRAYKSNYTSLLEGINVGVLPRNFVDALHVCSKLGIHYLWIDSLCIIQDDPEDWRHEAGLMHQVYKNAELTIAATSANSTHEGFLARDTYLNPVAKLEYSQDLDSERYMVLTPHGDLETGQRWGDIEGSLWNTRGWTMQERSLSTRIVHFCRNKLYFECRTRLRSEEGEPLRFRDGERFLMWPKSVTGQNQNNDIGLLREDLYGRWRKAVLEYGRRNLTHGSDKLRAIESLAAEMANSISALSGPTDVTRELGSYIPFAGMWKQNLHRELLWYVERGARVRPPLHDKRNVPSWSWASLDVQLGFQIGSRVTPNKTCPLANTGSPKTDSSSTSIDITSSAGWEIGNNPFRVLGLYTTCHDYHPTTVQNYIEIKALTRRITRITQVVDNMNYMDHLDRFALPFDLVVSDDNGELVTFARAALDLDDKDSLTSETKPLMYAHINSAQRPSGLVLQQSGKPHSSDVRTVWIRVGMATIFHVGGETILDPPFRDEDKAVSTVIV